MHIICFLSILEAIVPLNIPLKMSMAADCQTKNRIPSHILTSPPPPCVLVLTHLVCGSLAYLLVLFRFTFLHVSYLHSKQTALLLSSDKE